MQSAATKSWLTPSLRRCPLVRPTPLIGDGITLKNVKGCELEVVVFMWMCQIRPPEPFSDLDASSV